MVTINTFFSGMRTPVQPGEEPITTDTPPLAEQPIVLAQGPQYVNMAAERAFEQGVPMYPVATPQAPAQQGLSQRPLNAQEALQQGDPRLIELLRRRQQTR